MGVKKSFFNVSNQMPVLRVVLTSKCNFHCEYCPPHGENFSTIDPMVSLKKLLSLLEIFYKIGFRQFGFTGGEPLLRKDFSEVVSFFRNHKEAYLRLYTNGILLKKNLNLIKRINLIKLGLDTLDSRKFKQITGSDKHKDVLEGIKAARNNGVKIRINTVLTKRNIFEIFELISFCLKNKVDLKILDLNCYDFPGYDLWHFLYEDSSRIIEALNSLAFPKRYIYTAGGYGIPMPEYFYNGIFIRIKDTHKEAVFAPICYKCPYFPCQEGIYHLTLTVDGRLKMCRHRADFSVDLLNKDDKEIEESIIMFLEKYYYNAKRISVAKQVFQGYFGKSN